MRYFAKSSVMTLFAIVSFSLLVQGCVSMNAKKEAIQKIMDSWLGHHQSDLIVSWGPPTRTASDGKGGSILIYEQYVNLGQSPGRANVDYFGNVTYTNPQQRGYVRMRMFYVNEEGYIYYWRSQGF